MTEEAIATKFSIKCNYCGNDAPLVDGRALYPHRRDLWNKRAYKCEPCGAWVGCHPGSTEPLGRLANAELRKAKMAAHAVFDPLWRRGAMKRGQAYRWLADALGIDQNDCHIGMFDVAGCNRVIEAVKARAS